MKIGVSNRVIVRNQFGQFIRDCEKASEDALEEILEDGAELSRRYAPERSRTDHRTVKLKNSIHTKKTSSTSGYWYSTARHALPIERGAVPHPLPGNVTFWWEKHHRFWVPGENMIRHPGNKPQPFLRPAYEDVSRRAMRIVQKHYPG